MKEQRGIWSKLKDGLKKSREEIRKKVDGVLALGGGIDQRVLEELEEALITSDIGVKTAMEVIERLKERVKLEKISQPDDVKKVLKDILKDILEADAPEGLPEDVPSVILVVGVNGVGKTTTIGKLAALYRSRGKRVVIAAGDTFRAAAIEQLEAWSQRAGAEVIKHVQGSDPAAVVFDAINASKARDADLLICDTAGRLHVKKNLMDELKKIQRIINREMEDAARETYLVLDATTGQNALAQARLFKEAVDITGIILTKLDGTAKGGIALTIKNELGIPVRYIGVGEGMEDLQPFDGGLFVEAMLG